MWIEAMIRLSFEGPSGQRAGPTALEATTVLSSRVMLPSRLASVQDLHSSLSGVQGVTVLAGENMHIPRAMYAFSARAVSNRWPPQKLSWLRASLEPVALSSMAWQHLLLLRF